MAPTGSMMLAAAGLGWAESKGYLAKLPQIGGSPAVTLGLAGYAATRFSRNTTVRTAGLIGMIVGAFDFGRVQGGGSTSLQGMEEGYEEGEDSPW
jgi:hypothetical protein